MYNTISSSTAVRQQRENVNVFQKFYNWTVKQEDKRFMWLALTFVLQIGLALPCTLLSIVYLTGNNFNLWLLACVVNVPTLALNLAAQPPKVTLPVLFFAWVVDAAIIIYSFVSFFHT